MTEPRESETAQRREDTSNAKLRAALNYLGNRLTTHRTSQFRPRTHFLLDEWIAARRATPQASLPSIRLGEVESIATKLSMRFPTLMKKLPQ
jgi:hypothetical protein